MRKFKVVVEITKEYEVEIDESKLSEEDLEAWESVFYDLDMEEDKLTSYVSNYCEIRARLGNGFIEGYGVVLKKGEKADGYFIEDKEVNDEIKILKADDEGCTDVHLKELKGE